MSQYNVINVFRVKVKLLSSSKGEREISLPWKSQGTSREGEAAAGSWKIRKSFPGKQGKEGGESR